MVGMIKETDFRVGRRIKTKKGVFDIVEILFGGGKPIGETNRVVFRSLNGSLFPFKIEDIMEKEFEWIL